MIIQNSLKILLELTEIENKILQLEKLYSKNGEKMNQELILNIIAKNSSE